MTTSTSMPAALRRFFDAATRGDADAVVAAFDADAIVVDEGNTYRGAAAIREWREGVVSKYTYTMEILDTETEPPDRSIVTAHLVGDFPGGTADLKFDFTVAGDRISRLTIT